MIFGTVVLWAITKRCRYGGIVKNAYFRVFQDGRHYEGENGGRGKKTAVDILFVGLFINNYVDA